MEKSPLDRRLSGLSDGVDVARVGLIRLVEKHHAQMIYTRATKAGAAADE